MSGVGFKMHEQIKSFVIRNGRCGAKQNAAYLYGLCQYGLTTYNIPWCFDSIFGRRAETIVEIGFGMGHSLVTMAKNNPGQNFIGIEVHRPGIGQLLSEVLACGIKNLRVAPFDAQLAFASCIPAGSLTGIQIYFPDPWPKKRHFKRRLVQTEFVNSLSKALHAGGYLHCATDWEPYAQYMLEQITPCYELKNTSHDHTFVDKPTWRPQTKFEKRGLDLGHNVFDLLYTKEV